MQDHASSPAGSGTALPRVPDVPGDPVRPGALRVPRGARFPGARAAHPSAAVAVRVAGIRDEN